MKVFGVPVLRPMFVVWSLVLASGPSYSDPQDLTNIPKITKLPPSFYEFKIPPPPPTPEPEPAPIPEPEPDKLSYTDPNPSIRSAQAKRLLQKRRLLQNELLERIQSNSDKSEPEEIYAKDPHYRQWDQRTLEDKFTYPVDRRWVLTADRYISGLLETEINSEVPGRVTLVISRPVFAAEGWHVIFPQYTKIICEYQSLKKVSDKRLTLKCLRAIRPDGSSLLFTQAYGADAMGRNGLVGDIDYRTAERYGSAFVLAGIASLAGAGTNVSSNPILAQGAQNLSQNMGEVTAKVLDQNIDLAPLLTIEKGTLIHIRPQTDIWLREPIPKNELLKNQQGQPSQQSIEQKGPPVS
jgi:type IV secretion system protein VirB10